MRVTTACLIVAGAALLAAPAAYAQTTETVFEDPAGDAGPAGTELGPAASDLDIVEVTLASDDAARTSIAMELASFDVQPPDTFYGAAFHLGDTFVFAGYGKVVFPFPPFVHEGYHGCQVIDHDHNCTELDGRELSDADGFRVQLPSAWTPAGETAHDPMAAVFTDTFAPFASQATWQHVWPANAHDLATTDASHDVPDPGSADEQAAASDEEAQPASASGASAAGLAGSTIGLGAGAAGLLGLVGLAAGRLR